LVGSKIGAIRIRARFDASVDVRVAPGKPDGTLAALRSLSEPG
jgi:hypothetical protein